MCVFNSAERERGRLDSEDYGMCIVNLMLGIQMLSFHFNNVVTDAKSFPLKILSAPGNSYPDPTLWLDRLAATFR